MNKRELAKVKRSEASKEMFFLAERIERENYFVTTNSFELSGEIILLLNFFERSQLIKKKSEAAFRTFISCNDYITQDLKESRVKWKTGSLKNIIGWYWWDTGKKGFNTAFATDKDFHNAKMFINKYINKGDSSIWRAFERFQDEVMAERLELRHKKEKDSIDTKMKTVGELPGDFENWADETGLYFSRYLIYESGTRKKKLDCFCTHCKTKFHIDKEISKPRNNEKGECPVCGTHGKYKAYGLLPAYINDDAWLSIVQKTEQGFVMRYFKACKTYSPKEFKVSSLYLGERVRIFYEEGKTKTYEWGDFKQSGKTRWCNDMDKWNCANSVLYTNNLPEAWSGTSYQYCSLEILQNQYVGEELPHWHYLRDFKYRPYMEYFIKMGLFNLARGLKSGTHRLNTDGKSMCEILKITKPYIKILQELDGDSDLLRLLQASHEIDYMPEPKELMYLYTVHGCKTDLIRMTKYTTLHKMLKYFDKQSLSLPDLEQEGCCNAMYHIPQKRKSDTESDKKERVSSDWLEYTKWCKKLGYDLKNPFDLFPGNFYPVHDRVSAEYQAKQDEIARKEKEERDRQAAIALAEYKKCVEEALREIGKVNPLQMEYKGLMIVMPESAEDIKLEGQTLNHCVGTYVDKVAKRETMILFIRKKEDPGQPYYTMEYRNGKVAQCRGKRNCGMNGVVKAFVGAFERKMQELDKKKASNKVRMVG